jgi:hypothetical protein
MQQALQTPLLQNSSEHEQPWPGNKAAQTIGKGENVHDRRVDHQQRGVVSSVRRDHPVEERPTDRVHEPLGRLQRDKEANVQVVGRGEHLVVGKGGVYRQDGERA